MEEDIAEFEKFLRLTTRPNVKEVLARWIDKCHGEHQQMKLTQAQEPKKIVPIEESKDSMTSMLEACDNAQYIPITKFGWD